MCTGLAILCGNVRLAGGWRRCRPPGTAGRQPWHSLTPHQFIVRGIRSLQLPTRLQTYKHYSILRNGPGPQAFPFLPLTRTYVLYYDWPMNGKMVFSKQRSPEPANTSTGPRRPWPPLLQPHRLNTTFQPSNRQTSSLLLTATPSTF